MDKQKLRRMKEKKEKKGESLFLNRVGKISKSIFRPVLNQAFFN